MKQHARSLLSSILVLFVLITLLPASALAADSPFPKDPVTDTLLIANTANDSILYSRNADTVRTMASTTKIMTAVLILESVADIDHTMVTITEAPIRAVTGVGASMAGFQNHIGKSFSVRDLLLGLMIPSGCEAGQVLACWLSGSSSAFVSRMNARAKELGCTSTTFADSHGLSSANRTTAKDLYRIAKHAMTIPAFREIVSTEFYTVPGETVPSINTNKMVDRYCDTGFFFPYATGIKTGTTVAAGRCLVSSAKKGSSEFICVALGGKADANKQNSALTESLTLYRWVFENKLDYAPLVFDTFFKSLPVGESISLSSSLSGPGTARSITWTSSDPAIASVNSSGKVTAHSLGQVIIRAESYSGDLAELTLSCGFRNGIEINSDSGDTAAGSEYVNWTAVREKYGLDYAVIRAAVGSSSGVMEDREFSKNVREAQAQGLSVQAGFTAAATSAAEARTEASRLLSILRSNLGSSAPRQCSVVYNMVSSHFQKQSRQLNTEIALSFCTTLQNAGYSVICQSVRNGWACLDASALRAQGISICYQYCPYEPDFTAKLAVNDSYVPDFWLYRTDANIPEASVGGKARLCAAYCDTEPFVIPAPQPVPEPTPEVAPAPAPQIPTAGGDVSFVIIGEEDVFPLPQEIVLPNETILSVPPATTPEAPTPSAFEIEFVLIPTY